MPARLRDAERGSGDDGALEVIRTGTVEPDRGSRTGRIRGTGSGALRCGGPLVLPPRMPCWATTIGAAAIECVLGGLSSRRDGDLVWRSPGRRCRSPSTAPRPITLPAPGRGRPDHQAGHPENRAPELPGGGRGIDVPAILGSRSRDTLSGIGPSRCSGGTVACGSGRGSPWLRTHRNPAEWGRIRCRQPAGPLPSARCSVRAPTGSPGRDLATATGSCRRRATGSDFAWSRPPPELRRRGGQKVAPQGLSRARE